MLNKKPGLSKTWKWVIGIVIVLIAVISAISIYFSVRWKPVLTEKIKEVVYEGSNHLYQIDFKELHLNLLTGSVTADSILLYADTAVFNAQKKMGTAPTHLFQVKLKTLQLRRIGVFAVYFKKKIEMTDIILDRPSINMSYYKVYSKPDTSKDSKSVYERISKTLKSIHIKGIKIKDADFDYISGASGTVLNSVKKFNIQVRDILIDANSEEDTSRFYFTKDISFEVAGYSSVSKDKMYTMKIDTVSGSAAGKNIHIKGLKMIPMYPQMQFSRMLKTQKDRYDLAFDKIDFNGVDFLRLNSEGILHARSLRLKNAEAKIFMNREMPPGHGNKSGNFPHMALRRLPVATTIDTLKLRDVNVAYTEYNPISRENGTVHIDRLNGDIRNVTNDSISISKNKYAVADLKAYMIKAAQLAIRINFDLLDKNAAFNFKGNIGKMDMVKLNPLSEALGLVKIESGQIQKIDFDVRANAAGSRGTMNLYYNNLKIALLKEGEDGQATRKKGLLSFLANTLVIKDENPEKGKALRTAQIVFERPPGASFFNLLWKSVFIGMRETVGLGIIPMKSPEAGRKVVVKKLEERKEKKQEKAEKRKEEKEKKAAEKKEGKK